MNYPRIIFLSILLLLSIFISIDTYIGYRKNKYHQLYYSYGWLIIFIAVLLDIIKSISTEIILILPKNFITMVIFNIFLVLIALFGGIIVLKGTAQERNKQKR